MQGEQLFRWAVKGMGGILSILRELQQTGAKPDDVVIADLKYIVEAINWFLAVFNGQEPPPLEGTPSWPKQQRNLP